MHVGFRRMGRFWLSGASRKIKVLIYNSAVTSQSISGLPSFVWTVPAAAETDSVHGKFPRQLVTCNARDNTGEHIVGTSDAWLRAIGMWSRLFMELEINVFACISLGLCILDVSSNPYPGHFVQPTSRLRRFTERIAPHRLKSGIIPISVLKTVPWRFGMDQFH